MDNLPDIQENTKPEIESFIDCVGIDNVKVPIHFADNHNNYQVLASVHMGADLDCKTRAVSLSRFISYLSEYNNKLIIIPDDIFKLLKLFCKISKNESKTSNIRFDFDYMINRKSFISENIFPQFYKCFFQFELINDDLNIYQGLEIPYFSVCPCSQALCVNKGVPHSQRCKMNLFLHNEKIKNFNYLINELEDIVANKMYPIIKRVDEREIAVRALENTFFVEDIIRKVTKKLNDITVIKDWIVKCVHEDSIHQHDVFAIAYKGINNGFNKYTKI
jgi:GTP cyclohydrolase I